MKVLITSIALLLLLWQPATAETTETLTLDDYRLRLTVVPSEVTTGDTVSLIIQPLQRDGTADDVYFWVDTTGLMVTAVNVQPGKIRCTYRDARLLCFVEDLLDPEQVTLTGVVTGPTPDRRYFWLSAGQFDGGFVRLALRLTWRQALYLPLVGNGNN